MSITAGVTANYFEGVWTSGVTLRWVVKVWGLYSNTVYLSLIIASSCLATTLIIGVPFAYVLARKSGRITRLIEELLVLPLAVPGLAIAIGIILAYGDFRSFRTSWLFILVGHVIYTLPFMVRSVLAVLSSADFHTLEEGAASLGAGFWQRFRDIVVPNCRSGILAGSLMVFTLSIGEFNLTWLLHTPLNKTLPIGLANSYASMRLEVASAYTLVFFVMIIPLLIALQHYGRPAQRLAKRRTTVETSPADRLAFDR
jgi:putative spermidine/putrescine transport system permease protein